MRWSIVRLIWLRELRDQLRDRRTVFMIVVLPLLLYPVLGLAVIEFAFGFVEKPSVVGIQSKPDNFPPRVPEGAGLTPLPVQVYCALAPGDPLAANLAAGLAQVAHVYLDYPQLVTDGRFAADYLAPTAKAKEIGFEERLQVMFLDSANRTPLDTRQVDLIVSAPADFWAQVEKGGHPTVEIVSRPGDDRSRQARKRLNEVLSRWQTDLKNVRLRRLGLPDDFDQVIQVHDDTKDSSAMTQAQQNLWDQLARIFPFMLVMWSLAGALYPAVDVCAGEKERGTMETLLISPASREEIVYGKFLTIWVFSAATALLNLASMGITTWLFAGRIPHTTLQPASVFWCILLALPLSAFFSAVCLSVGAYARSSKEGQYYLMPLFLITMPLIFLTLAPGVELNAFYSLVPVTGVALLMQQLLTASGLDQVPWPYFVPVLAPTALYSWLALRWAVGQFKREEVLFREAERLDLHLWLRRLFREKEPLPSTGQALFCFALILALRWLTLGIGSDQGLIHLSVMLVAFVAAPALLMAVLLTTRPREGLGLRLPALRDLVTAVLLAAVLLWPLGQLSLYILDQFPQIKKLIEDQPMVAVFQALGSGAAPPWWQYVLIMVLPAVCEELAFRGFILTGLRRRFSPWKAILLSSFLFALSHMNVFQLLPFLILGVFLGWLTVRSGSVFPAMLFHLVHNGLLFGIQWLKNQGYAGEELPPETALLIRLSATVLCLLLAAVLLWRLSADDRRSKGNDPGKVSVNGLPDRKPETMREINQIPS